MMCYVESRHCPFTVVANKTKLRKEQQDCLKSQPVTAALTIVKIHFHVKC